MLDLLDYLRQFWSDLQQGQLPQLGLWNYLILSVLIIWQGPIAAVLGGAAASAGLLRPWLVFLCGAAGNLIADIVWYSVGRRANSERITALRWLGLTRERLAVLEHATQKHAVRILLIAKLSAGLAVPALFAAGMTKVRWKRWLPVVVIGETIWTGGLVLLGFYLTESIKRIQQGIHFIAIGITLASLIVVMWLVPRVLRDSESLKVKQQEDHPNHPG